MRVRISGHKIKITPAIRKEVTILVERLKKHAHYMAEVEFKLQFDNEASRNQRFTVEITAFVQNAILKGEVEGGSLTVALSDASRKLDKQIALYERMVLSKRKGVDWLPQLAILPNKIRSVEIRKEAKIVKRKNWLFGKPATEDEAVEQMELLSHDWFIFKNKKTKRMAVIYRRHDGNYGLIDVR